MATYIRLASGQYLEVPEGMTPAQALQMRTAASRERASMAAPEFATEVGEGATGFREGIGAGLTRVGETVGEFAARPFRSDEEERAAQDRLSETARLEAPLRETGRGAAGAFIGETAATLPLGGVTTAGLRTLGARGALPMAARLAASPYGRGIAEGAVIGGLTAKPGEGVSGALTGGALGGAAAGGGMLLRRALAGSRPSRAALALEKQGIDLTPGQRVKRLPGGQAGTLATAEQSATSIPLAGSLVSAPRETAETQFAKVFASKAAPPGIVPKLTGNARTDLDRLSRAYDTAYQKVLNYPVYPKIMRTAGGDIPLAQVVDDAARKGIDVKEFIDPKLLKRLANPLRAIDAADVQQMRSQVRRELGKLRRLDQSHPENRNILRSLRELESKFTDALESQAPKGKIEALGKVDAAYRNFAAFEDAVEKAVAMLPKQGGQLSTAQIMRGVIGNAAERGGRRALTKGEAPMQKLAEQGLEVFAQDVPQTGTLTRFAGAATGLPLTAIYGLGGGRALGRGLAPGLRKSPLARSLRQSGLRQLPGRAARAGVQAYNSDED